MTERTPEALPIALVGLDGHVVGLDRRTGQILWKNGLIGGLDKEVELACYGNYVFASASGPKHFALDYFTGEQIWAVPTSGSGRAALVVEPDMVMCAKEGAIDCYNFAGQRLWSQALRGLGTGKIAMGFPGNLRQADEGS